MGSYIVAITGASGSVYGMRLVERLLAGDHEVALVVTPTATDILGFELGFDLPVEEAEEALLGFLELPADVRLRIARPADLFDPIASGSHPTDAMIVAPASMGFCASVANGLATNLCERAAAVALKEGRPLILMPRETPLSLVHLRNLTALAEAGASIVPAMPAFYHRPRTLDDQVNFVVGKAFDLLGVEHELYRRWGE